MFSLLLKENNYKYWGLEFPQPSHYLRMLGASYVALLIGYWYGLLEAKDGKLLVEIIVVGVISNGLGAIILGYYGFIKKKWRELERRGRIIMWLCFAFATYVAIGLFYNLLYVSNDYSCY